jgi:hypothetical protein
MNEMATLHATIGGLAAAVALAAWLGDRRRARRRNPDAVGWVPWTSVFFVAMLIACVFLGLAAREWFAG